MKLSALPLQVRLALAGGLILLVIAIGAGLYFSGRSDGKATERTNTAQAGQKAVTKARNADAAAQTAVDAGKASAGAEVDRGREAADRSEDPWKSATEAMRR